MGSEGDQPDTTDNPPKKKSLALSLFLGPTTDVQTLIGKLYLFPLGDADVSRFEKLAVNDPSARLREFLPYVASLSSPTKIDKDREPLANELIAQLTDDEVETIAEAYALSSALKEAREGSKEKSGLPREDGEMPTAYLDRLLKKEVEEKQWMRKQMLASTSSIFDQVRKSSSVLGSTLTDYERISRTIATPAIETKHLELSNHMAEHHARLGRERAEKLEMVRLTGQMTAQSAMTLRDLAEAASTLLENLDARDKRSDQMTRIQLWIAVASVVVSAVLSGAAFFQDRANNTTNDKWQEELLTSINESNRQRTTAEEENKKLKAKVEELSEAVSRLSATEVTQPEVPGSKCIVSVARRVTSPSKTLPPQ